MTFLVLLLKDKTFFCVEMGLWKGEALRWLCISWPLFSDATVSFIMVSISSQLWKGISCLFVFVVFCLGFFFGVFFCCCFFFSFFPSLADDAKEAVKIGVNGILVSNHGARQLDGVPATVSTDANMYK